MGRPLQFIFTVFLITLAFSKVNGDSSQQSNELKFDDVKDLPTSLKRHGSALPPRAETHFDIKPNNSFTRFLTPQNGQQPEEAEIEKLKQLALEKNSAVKNGQNNSVDAVQKQHPQQSAVQKNVPGNDGHSGNPLAIQQVQEKPHMKPPPVPVPSHQAIPIPSQTHAQSPQQPSVIRSDSKMPTNPEAEYNQGKFREELEYAERTPELWFANVKWSCPKGDENEKCKGWEKIYVAIERYITMARKFAMGEEVPLEMVAARPDFDPKKLDRTQTNVIGKLQWSRILNLQREEIPSQLNVQKEGEPLYVENGEMEMVQVMRMVELAYEMNKKGANIQNNPVYMLNEELVEKVYEWAAFYADAIKFLKSGKIEKFYKIDKDIDKVLKGSLFKPVMTMIQTLDDFAREKERAQIILEQIRKEKGIDDLRRLPFRYSFPPLPLELTDQVIHAQKKDILNESMQEREKFANLWQSIVETLRKEKAKKTFERYALRRRNEQPRITHDLVYHVVLPIPRPEEFVHTVYVYANGKPLGRDLAEALVKAEYCLDEIRGNMSKQLAELKEECPIPPNIETDRKEKFDAFFDVAKGLKSGLPTFLDKNGRKMDWDEVLPLVEDAFDAIVSGKKLDVFLPTIKREGRIKGMAADYANQIPKQQVPEKPIRPVKGADGMTDAQREFKKRDDEKKHDDEEMKKLKLEKEELEKKKKEMQKIKWAEQQKKYFEARKLEKEKLANEKLEKEKLDKEKKEMQKLKWAAQEKKHFEAKKLLKNEKLAKEKLEKQNLRVHGYRPIPAIVTNKEKIAIWPASHRRVVAY